MLNRGADVIFGVGGRLGQGALRRAVQAGAWSIGSEQDQFYRTREASGSLLSSAVPQAQEAVYEFIRRLAAGNQGTDMLGDMILAPYHEGERFVPLSAQAALLALDGGLEDGSLTIHPMKPR
jgi:hypothetical protein